jgi:putative ABC transport system permease protein
VAITLVLLIASALCVRSFARLAQLDLGFNPENVLTFSVRWPVDAPPMSRAEGDDVLERMLARLERTPQVVAAGAVSQLPFRYGPVGWDTSFLLEGQADSPDSWARNPHLNLQVATPNYFRAMGIPLLGGRVFTDRDRADGPLVVIVSEALADRLWPGQDPLGKRIRTGFTLRQEEQDPARWQQSSWQTVVGVVRTARYREIESSRLDIYVPFRQADPIVESFTVRTAVDPESLVPALSAAMHELYSGATLDRVTTMDAIVGRARGPWLFSAAVFSVFGLVALGLSWLGLFGLVAFAVTQRTREIGVRMALGAVPADVVRLMVRHGLTPALAGVVLGLVAALPLTRFLDSLLFETSPTDASTFAIVSAGFAFASLLASYIPARRAASVNPVVALRNE